MNVFKIIARYFARKSYCRSAIAEHADLSVFRKKPSSRVIIGLVLIAVSYLIGLPAAVILSVFMAARGNTALAAVAVPLLYGISWVLLMAGIYLAGPEYGKSFNRWFTRVILEKILGDEVKDLSSLPPPGSKQPRN